MPVRQLMYTTVRSGILERNELIGRARVSDLAARVQTLYDTAMAIQSEQSVSRLMFLSDLLPKNAPTLTRAKTFLRALQISQEKTLGSFVLFKKNNALLSDAFVEYEYSRGYGDLFHYQGLDAQAWRSRLLENEASISLLPTQRVHCIYFPAPLTREVLTVCIGLNALVPPDRVGVVAFLLDAHEITRTLKPDDLAQSSAVALLDAGGNRLLGDLPWPLPDADEYTVISYEEPEMHFAVHLGIPNAYIQAHCNELLQVVQFYMATGLLLSVVLIVFYTSRQFIPVNRLLVESTRLTNRPYSPHSEYRAIGDALQEISSRNHEMKKQLSLLQNTYRTSLIENACLRGIHTQREQQALEQLLSGASGCFCVAVLRIENDRDASPEEALAIHTQTVVMARIPYDTLPFLADQGETVYLILLPDDSADALNAVEHALREAVESLTAFSSLKAFAGVSRMDRENRRMHACYRQAKRAMLQCAHGQAGPVGVYDAHTLRRQPLPVDANDLVKLSNLILAGEMEGVAHIFDRLTERVQKHPMDDAHQPQQFYFALRLVLETCIAEMQPDAEQTVIPAPDAAASVLGQLELLRQCALCLCAQCAESRHKRSSTRAENLLDYIAAHSADPALSAALLAERFSLSEKYVYQYVREQTGKTLGDMIESCRMARAEKFLLETDWSNERVAQDCGFGTANTFYRIFRKVHGIAPGVWRSRNKVHLTK